VFVSYPPAYLSNPSTLDTSLAIALVMFFKHPLVTDPISTMLASAKLQISPPQNLNNQSSYLRLNPCTIRNADRLIIDSGLPDPQRSHLHLFMSASKFRLVSKLFNFDL
jgi:hypothetical protein